MSQTRNSDVCNVLPENVAASRVQCVRCLGDMFLPVVSMLPPDRRHGRAGQRLRAHARARLLQVPALSAACVLA